MRLKSLSRPLKEANGYSTARRILSDTGLSVYYALDTITGEMIKGVLQDRAALREILKFIRKHKEHLNRIKADIELIDDLYIDDEEGFTYEPGDKAMWFYGDYPVERRVGGVSEYCVSAIEDELARLEQL